MHVIPELHRRIEVEILCQFHSRPNVKRVISNPRLSIHRRTCNGTPFEQQIGSEVVLLRKNVML